MARTTEQQFIEIYREHAPQIFKFCYFKVNSKEEAEDLASKTFMKTWDYIAQGEEVENIRAFLYRVARNTVIDFYKTNKRGMEISIHGFGDDTIDLPDSSDQYREIDTKQLMNEVSRHLEKLPEQYRDIITLRYIQDLDIKEIAEALEISENNVSVKLHRAVEKLKSLAVNPNLT